MLRLQVLSDDRIVERSILIPFLFSWLLLDIVWHIIVRILDNWLLVALLRVPGLEYLAKFDPFDAFDLFHSITFLSSWRFLLQELRL